MLRDGVVDILEYQRRGRASACILQVIRSGSTRYDSHILDIDTLWTGVSLIVISSKALALRPIYVQEFPSPLQRPLSHVFSTQIPPEDVSMTCAQLDLVFSMNVSP